MIDCACFDPQRDLCYIVFPSSDTCTTGPYNRLHGQKLLEVYEEDSWTQGRVMLMDADLLDYIRENLPKWSIYLKPGAIPMRLIAEYTGFALGGSRGPAMEQEHRFKELCNKNNTDKQQMSQQILQEIQSQVFTRPDTDYMCYCRNLVPEDCANPASIVTCSYRDCATTYFHKSCVQGLGVDKVSRWYCTSCEKKMKVVARQALGDTTCADAQEGDGADFARTEKTLRSIWDVLDQNTIKKIGEYVLPPEGKVGGDDWSVLECLELIKELLMSA